MMQGSPKVSVCIPTYNRANYVGEAIKSVLNQTLKDLELIIVDDASTDNSIEVIEKFKDPRIKFYKNEKNLGMVGNWNKAVSLASGKYITILHSDDKYLPQFLAAESKLLDRDPEIGYIFSACRIIDENGNLHWVHKWQEKKHFGLFILAKDRKTSILDGHEVLKEHVYDNFVRFPTVMIRRECYDKVGMYTNKFRFGPDWNMWMRIELHPYKVAYLEEAYAEYRKHAGTDTTFLVSRGETTIDDYKVITDILKEASQKNIFSQKEEKRAVTHITRVLLKDYYKRIWDFIKKRQLEQAQKSRETLKKWKKEFNIKYNLIDILFALAEIKL